MVRESAESLLTIINDILDFSKIEAGKLDLEEVAFGLRERVRDLMKSLALRAHVKGLELAWRIDPDTPDALLGDPTRLGQIILNLVGNDVEFTEQGEVVLQVRCESRTDSTAVLRFSVGDRGMGISPGKLTSIFETFTQADASTSRGHGGTSLGLAITSRWASLMDGGIWAESKIGHGSVFHLSARFKLARGKPPDAPQSKPVTLRETRVMIVDDNATNRCTPEDMTRNWGMRPTAVESARQAISLRRQFHAAEARVPWVLSDVNMPDMDGFTLTKWIRQDTDLSDTTVIVLTSGVRPENIKLCNQLDVAAHLLKTVKQSALLNAIELSLRAGAVEDKGVETFSGEPKIALPSLRVLLVQDSLVNQNWRLA